MHPKCHTLCNSLSDQKSRMIWYNHWYRNLFEGKLLIPWKIFCGTDCRQNKPRCQFNGFYFVTITRLCHIHLGKLLFFARVYQTLKDRAPGSRISLRDQRSSALRERIPAGRIALCPGWINPLGCTGKGSTWCVLTLRLWNKSTSVKTNSPGRNVIETFGLYFVQGVNGTELPSNVNITNP